MQAETAIKRLETLPELAQAGKTVSGLFRLLTHRPLWTEGLERIKRNKGAGTPGVDGTKVSDLGETDIEMAIQSLMDGTYHPKPVRRVYIPKSNGKLRPLGIPTATDRMVQEVVRSILNRIYEPVFSDHSHGFRQGRSCHTALDHIRKVWKGVKWFVEVDIKGYFDNIDHSILLKLLSKRIEDKKFLTLIDWMLKAGFLEDWKFNKTYSGTPQGGIISPLLANIYLHELDMLMEREIKDFDKGKERKRNNVYSNLAVKISNLKLKADDLRSKGQDDEANKIMEERRVLRSKLIKMPSVDPMDPNYRRLRYVRYADDFLIGIIGGRDEAYGEIMFRVERLLNDDLNLEISEEKSGIRKASKGVQFLGYNVRVRSAKSRFRKVKAFNGLTVTKRSLNETLQISVPAEKVRGFAKRHEYGHFDLMKATHKAKLLHCDDVEIVRIYNAELRGFANYYALAWDVKTKLSKLAYLWRTSLYKTLANKHKTSTSKLFAKTKDGPGTYTVRQVANGKDVSAKVWRLADLKLKKTTFGNIDDVTDEDYLVISRTNWSDRVTATQCYHCKTENEPLHIHHANPMRKGKTTGYAELQSARKRRTLPLCVDCHKLLHAGKLPDMRVRKMKAESRVP